MFSNDIVKVEEAILKSKCNFELTLDYKNDQTQTELAIKVIQEFLDNFPNTIYYSNASDMIIDLRDKLAKKNYEDGRLYLKLKNMTQHYIILILLYQNMIQSIVMILKFQKYLHIY